MKLFTAVVMVMDLPTIGYIQEWLVNFIIQHYICIWYTDTRYTTTTYTLGGCGKSLHVNSCVDKLQH